MKRRFLFLTDSFSSVIVFDPILNIEQEDDVHKKSQILKRKKNSLKKKRKWECPDNKSKVKIFRKIRNLKFALKGQCPLGYIVIFISVKVLGCR